MFTHIVSRMSFIIYLIIFSPHAAIARKYVKANGTIEAAMKINRIGYKNRWIKKYGCIYSDSIASKIDSLITADYPEWKEENQDTLYFATSNIHIDSYWKFSVFTSKYRISIIFAKWVPLEMHVARNGNYSYFFYDIIRKWNVNAFRVWKTTKIKDNNLQRATRIISKGNGKYGYEYYDLYDNTDFCEYLGKSSVIYKKTYVRQE